MENHNSLNTGECIYHCVAWPFLDGRKLGIAQGLSPVIQEPIQFIYYQTVHSFTRASVTQWCGLKQRKFINTLFWWPESDMKVKRSRAPSWVSPEAIAGFPWFEPSCQILILVSVSLFTYSSSPFLFCTWVLISLSCLLCRQIWFIICMQYCFIVAWIHLQMAYFQIMVHTEAPRIYWFWAQDRIWIVIEVLTYGK